MQSKLFIRRTAVLFTLVTIAIASYASTGHDHEKNKQMGGHMDHMNDVRHMLKHELGENYNLPVPEANSEQLASGQTIFNESCAACHGRGGKGDGPAATALKQKPADLTDAEHSKYYSDQGRIYIIKNGIAGTPMSGWKQTLDEREIQSVYAYIRSLRDSTETEGHEHTEHKH
jgi:cytochrome c553